MARTMLKTKQPPKLTLGKKTPAASRAPRKSARGGGSQRFVVSHPNEADFKAGLRAYAKYRDLGIRQATGGLAQAHVIRFVPPFRAEEVSQLHYHDVEFQMIYVLKGWIRSEFEGQGAHTMHAGACWIQPPRIEHKVLGYSDDCEVLEIILPAEFETVMLD
jgi:quercetin dioxygenase-like cupin family protein